jgi:histidinol-phosphate aminotransferase
MKENANSFSNVWLENINPYKVASHKVFDNRLVDHLKLDWNEGTVSLYKNKLIDGIIEYIDKIGLNIYPDVANEELLRLLSDYASVSSENIQYFSSSDSSHEVLTRTFLNVNDCVLILGPTYDNFRLNCETMGAKCFFTEYKNSSIEIITSIQKSIEKINPKLVYICNPNNPTGDILERDVLVSLIRNNKNVLFIIDEAYFEFGGITLSDICLTDVNLIITRTMSKAFCLAGIRFGYIIAPKLLLSSINKVRNPKSVAALSQICAIVALNNIDEMKSYVKEVLNAKVEFVDRLIAMNIGINIRAESGGNFLLMEFKDEYLRKIFISAFNGHNIYVREFTHISGLEKYLRITIGTRPQMMRVIEAIACL